MCSSNSFYLTTGEKCTQSAATQQATLALKDEEDTHHLGPEITQTASGIKAVQAEGGKPEMPDVADEPSGGYVGLLSTEQ